ncbi:hypothetical protein [Prauserella endophytica]|uniref:Uncharacterized protein n=1 Tax=Prauserella endophytica TaxID=1592324 RepID=A0ABY2RS79_9PSEU|nr:hypothetical protein [Prauserella endophytica]TKG58106.1 hypothetical protein FCN18_38440 [Prauserella endophytica]
MSPEAITAIFSGLVALLGGWNARQGQRIKAQDQRIQALEEKVGALTSWKDTARDYIGTLLFVMRTHGITPPEPPPSLGLTIPKAPNQTEEH